MAIPICKYIIKNHKALHIIIKLLYNQIININFNVRLKRPINISGRGWQILLRHAHENAGFFKSQIYNDPKWRWGCQNLLSEKRGD